uniref:asparagine synthase (glutamine-hydrolyzing) n=1 Tax=Ignavibacterium album TaxID=591197 RepID=A0A832G7D9_9BACT
MCGILGIISYQKPISEKEIDLLTNTLSRRGPDDRGIFSDGKVSFGHRRLSVIDLVSGHQPMKSKDGKQIIVYNGEIYNYLQIKKQLTVLGINFNTTSDTEVILEAYRALGFEKMLSFLEGMFAFALYDIEKNLVYLVRDRFGEKPLYYYKNNTKFYFASELKALELIISNRSINLTALNLFFALTYIPAPYTIYNDVYKLQQGHYLKIGLNGNTELKNYYNLAEIINSNELITDYEEAKSELKELLFDSVKARLISDVPLGAFLSGGIDSSIISSIMAQHANKPIKTFTIGFKEKQYDESERAALVAKHIGSEHTIKFIDHNDILKTIDEVIDYFDEPFGDSSALPTYFVSKMTKEYVTVALTGDCGDELFGGYEKYLAAYYVNRFKRLPSPLQGLIKSTISLIPHTPFTNSFLRKTKKVINNAGLTHFDLHFNLMSLGFGEEERKSLLNSDYFETVKSFVLNYYDSIYRNEPMDKGFYTDINVVLEGDMLTKVDRMSMINSLETRVPFLDSKIVEFSQRLPLEFKISGTQQKKILKDTFGYLLPEETLKFSKRGFGIPINLWFRNELRPELEKVLNPSLIEKQDIFDYNAIKKIFDEHMSGKENHTSKLWCLYVFQKWYAKHF